MGGTAGNGRRARTGMEGCSMEEGVEWLAADITIQEGVKMEGV